MSGRKVGGCMLTGRKFGVFMRVCAALAVLLGMQHTVAAGNETHTAVACATTTTQALAAEPFRTYTLFINDSDTTIYLKTGAAAVVNEGVRLNANGGSWEMGPEFSNLSGAVVNCIHGGSSTKTLLVFQMDNS